MNEKWLLVIGPLAGAFATAYVGRLNFLGTKETNKDKAWESLYKNKNDEYIEVKQDLKETKQELKEVYVKFDFIEDENESLKKEIENLKEYIEKLEGKTNEST